ncbi:MAG TPA: hypothetical protein VJT71_07550 [Pyrinomonadaceae bacterium]|nr:hypothetical protein [Pyrinomonadaceae bacterium]
MNEQGLQNETPAELNSQSNLSEPHFDDIAIAIAQPVEPLAAEIKPSGWQRIGSLSRRISTTALLLILAGVVGFASATFGLAVHRQLAGGESQAAVTSPAEPAELNTMESSSSDDETRRSPRPVRKAQPRVINSQVKPVARLVGEIR